MAAMASGAAMRVSAGVRMVVQRLAARVLGCYETSQDEQKEDGPPKEKAGGASRVCVGAKHRDCSADGLRVDSVSEYAQSVTYLTISTSFL